MQSATLPNQPERGGDFQYDDGRYCRVTIRPPTFNGSEEVLYKATAYLVDSSAGFVLSPSGAPTSTPETQHAINKSGIAAGTHTLYAGWCKYSGMLDVSATNIPAGWTSGNGAPAVTGGEQDGDGYVDLDTGQGYQFSIGELPRIQKAKAEELLRRVGPIGQPISF